MKKVLKSIAKNMLFYAVLLSAMFIASKQIINYYNMEYRNLVYVSTVCVIFLLIVIGIIQIFGKIKDILIRAFLIATFLVLITIIASIGYFIYTLSAPYENVVQKNNKNLVGYSYSNLTTKVKYYNYINLIVRGKELVLYEEIDD